MFALRKGTSRRCANIDKTHAEMMDLRENTEMDILKRFTLAGRAAAAAGLLIAVAGCGTEGRAGDDPGARIQTQADAKSAMDSQSKKKSDGKTQQQSTRGAMEAGAKQQRSAGK